MRIARVSIINFRNFRDVTVETGRNLILVGANATGKSNFIYALRLIFDPSLSRRDRRLSEDDFWRGDGQEPWRGREIKISVDLTDFVEDVYLNAHLQNYCLPDQEGVVRLSYIYKPRPNIPPEEADEQGYEYYLYGGDDESKRIQGDLREHLCLSVIDALRNADADLVSRNSPLRRLFNLYHITPDKLTEIVKHMQEANSGLKQINEVSHLAAAIGDRLVAMTEQIHDLRPSLRLLSEDAGGLLRALRLMVEGGYPIASTSLGLANVLYLTLCILEIEAREQIRRPIRGEEYLFTILAIEEPEAHIHPHLQRLLFRDFLKRSPLILSTHSPYIASVSQVDSIIMFRRPDPTTGVEIHTTAKLQRLLSNSQLANLARHLDVTRAELLFARAIILVEGDAEELLIPALARLAGYDLDRFGITVCSMHSTDFVPFVTLCGSNGLNIPFVILTDGDKYAKLRDGLVKARDAGKLTPETFRQAEDVRLSEQRELIDRLGVAYYYGLKRCIDLLPMIQVEPAVLTEVTNAYDGQLWDKVITILGKYGIFVNEWSLEPSLLQEGYASDYLEILAEEGIGPRIMGRLQAFADGGNQNDVETYYFLQRIEDVGKGRVAHRLCAKIMNYTHENSDKSVPLYIRNAIEFLVNKLKGANDEIKEIVNLVISESTASDKASNDDLSVF